MGPCGLFAGLVLAQMGFRPIILERGKAVRERTVDTFGLWRKKILNPESNVQFGEGGAGTFSDGKLYSQISDKRHYGRKVLTEFVKAGAPEEILYVSKPHIGTFRLVSMVEQHARDDRIAGRRDPFLPAASTTAGRNRCRRHAPRARRDAGRAASNCAPTTWCWRSATARATPSRCCTSAACSSKPSRSRSASASSIRNR